MNMMRKECADRDKGRMEAGPILPTMNNLPLTATDYENTTTFEYDEAGEPAPARDEQEGNTTRYEYDELVPVIVHNGR